MAYTIKVKRNLKKGIGTLTYKSGGVSVNTKCWFMIKNPIPAKTYTRCSATYMRKKKNSKGGKREGIFLPNNQTKRRGIFIHMGTSHKWSDGCIVIKESLLLKIWNSLPLNKAKVTVIVSDS